jgi:hypothetical protein
MQSSFSAPIIPSAAVMANIPLASGNVPQAVQKNVTMLLAAQIGQATLNPSSFFAQVNANRYYISRLFFFPSEPQKLDFDQKKRREFIRGVIVNKTDTSNDTADKPKE